MRTCDWWGDCSDLHRSCNKRQERSRCNCCSRSQSNRLGLQTALDCSKILMIKVTHFLIPPLITRWNSQRIYIGAASRISHKCLHTHHHIEDISRCYTTRRTADFKDFPTIGCIESNGKNLTASPHFISYKVNSSLIPIIRWLCWRTSKLHIVTKIQIQPLSLCLLLNNRYGLTDVFISLHLTRVHPRIRTKIVVLSNSIADLINRQSWKRQRQCRTGTVNSIGADFRS